VRTDKAQLMEENRRLRAELVCRQCRTDKVQTLFLPCQHLVACQRCGDAMDDCIRCGQKILGTVRTYILWPSYHRSSTVFKVWICGPSPTCKVWSEAVVILSSVDSHRYSVVIRL